MAREKFDVVIIGAGGAGMMSAIWAGRRGRRVLLLDHSSKLGRKILISGGGRCNFTNLDVTPENYVSKNPHFAKSALARYKSEDFIDMVKSHRIPFHEKKLGQLFCDGSAADIVDMLADECHKAGARFAMETRIDKIESGDRFLISSSRNQYECESLVIATGGLSIPQIGATGFGYDIARQFGLQIVETAAALDGFNLSQADLKRFTELSGVSLDTIVTCGKASFRENILFTHNGLSGPASLQASLYWTKGKPVAIDLLPGENVDGWLDDVKERHGKAEMRNVLADLFPKRFAERFCILQNLNMPLNQIPEGKLKQLALTLHDWQIFPAGTVGYKKAEVTRGGVDTKELSSQTMEARKVPGLYFVGEVVDVTGWLGGYNFQWAWSSGFAAGQAC